MHFSSQNLNIRHKNDIFYFKINFSTQKAKIWHIYSKWIFTGFRRFDRKKRLFRVKIDTKITWPIFESNATSVVKFYLFKPKNSRIFNRKKNNMIYFCRFIFAFNHFLQIYSWKILSERQRCVDLREPSVSSELNRGYFLVDCDVALKISSLIFSVTSLVSPLLNFQDLLN